MTILETKIRAAQRRLWLNLFVHSSSTCIAIAGGLFAIVALVQRLFALPIPLIVVGISMAVTALAAAVAWTVAFRAAPSLAAARLDQAAGLRERISSGRYCLNSDDPFAAAVVSDAERISASITPRQHLRIVVPPALGWAGLSIVLSAGMFLISPGLLKSQDAVAADREQAEVEQAKLAVKRQMDQVRRIAEITPAMPELQEKLGEAEQIPSGQLQRPSDVRHEAMKKIDTLADAIKQKRSSEEYDAARDVQRRLRGLKAPQSEDSPTQKLAESLMKGEFEAAKEEIEKLKEQLASLKSEEDKEFADKMSRQLQDIAKQLEQLAKNEQLEKKLEQLGVKKEDVERMLENLKKEDLEQLQKQLEEKGLGQREIEQIAKQLQQQQGAKNMMNKMAQAMGQGAKAAGAGKAGEAAAGLSAAADQLSELEQLEQEMNQLDAALAELQNAQENLDNPCTQCNGTGMNGGKRCSSCQGSGRDGSGAGMGKLGQGRGGLADEQEARVDFKTERGKVETQQGEIIGQFLVEGEQVKGDTPSNLADAVAAAEHEASDRINRNRVPRQYHKAIRNYFSSVQRSIEDGKTTAPPANGTPPIPEATEPPTEESTPTPRDDGGDQD